MPGNRIVKLLEADHWGEDQALVDGLKEWEFYPLLLETYRTLREDALYKSKVHGSGHIHRVLLFAGLIAWKEHLSEADVRQYFRAACYHDVGRTFDGYDLDHGARSALRIEELTGQTGEELVQLKAAVTAHARPDDQMEEILHSFQLEQCDRTLELTRLLKDADNLDRVRLGDLKEEYLRHDSAKSLAGFSLRLFRRDQAEKRRQLEEREKAVRRWFSLWLTSREEGLEALFAPDCVYTESWGPQYTGLPAVRHWFREWTARGRVLEWEIKQFLHKGDQTIVEWRFQCAMKDGSGETLDGMSLVDWIGEDTIYRLKEYGCKTPHYDPYQKTD